MDFEKIIHTIIDGLVTNVDAILITRLPDESEKDYTFLICAEDNDIAKLIGHKGSVASAIREVMNVAGSKNKVRVHIKFESLNPKEKVSKED